MEKLGNVKQIEVKPNGRAEFSLDMKLWDSNSTISLYKVRQDHSQNDHFFFFYNSTNMLIFSVKNGNLVPYGNDEKCKHSLKIVGTKYVFTINNPQPEDAGFYQLDVDETNVLTTDFQGILMKSICNLMPALNARHYYTLSKCLLYP